ncbi:endonuclease [Lysobacter sp. TY2-98]|uniref:S1/P1 nuclease n=1 Tax=Lysobacter sp. TY2-98 TaxID=2290922 RepID=UPI000E200FEC|nr:S1/P1 nuclease [Lysobacter sp. TY2-98]AXK71148.1 endonuclease [Lysobacter sp. TY2-98]
MIRRLLASALLCAIASPAFAWGAMGHRLVADLAADELTPAARHEVDVLLKGEAEPTLAGIANWADALRANDPDLGKRSAKWHYADIAENGCGTYEPPRDCPNGDCVIEAIRAQTKILADHSQSIDARRQALKFVVHFIGDVHQPLHAAFARDKGGNTVQVRIPTADGGEKGSNLHSLWDSGLIELTGLDEAAYLAKLRALPLVVDIPTHVLPPDSPAWAQTSCRIATRPGVYPSGTQIDAAYAATFTPLIDEQLRRGGTHLAQVLNAALAP